MTTKLTRTDKKILYHLDIDARINYSELAKKVKTTKQVVRYRIQRLEKLEVIKNYYAIIDYSKLGLTKYRINLKLRTSLQKKILGNTILVSIQHRTWKSLSS